MYSVGTAFIFVCEISVLGMQCADVNDSKAEVRSVAPEPSSTVCQSDGSPMDSLPVQEETQPFVDEFDRGCLSVVPESVNDDFDLGDEMVNDEVDLRDETVSSARSEDIISGTMVCLRTQRISIQ